MFESHAQNCEDVVLWRVLGHIEHGTYVDVGAADPDEDSVTKAFYERGWSGLNVEPAEEYAERLRRQRPRDATVQMCAGAEEGTITFHHVLGTGLSSVVEASISSLADTPYEVVDIEVPVRRLDQILDDAHYGGRDIHFLKIDVEGFEESVLRGIDLRVWRPWVIVAEATAPRSPQQVHHAWEHLLLDRGYQFCLFDGLNRFYIAEEHAGHGAALSYPACFFDQPYAMPAHAKLLREYDNLLEGEQRVRALYEGAIGSYDELNRELQRSLESYGQLEGEYRTTVDAYGRLETQYTEATDGYAVLRREYDNALRGYELLQHEHSNALLSYANLEGELERAVAAIAELQSTHVALCDERDRLREGIATMSADIDSVRAARDAARHELELTRQTLSWRVTKPLRAVRRLRAR